MVKWSTAKSARFPDGLTCAMRSFVALGNELVMIPVSAQELLMELWCSPDFDQSRVSVAQSSAVVLTIKVPI